MRDEGVEEEDEVDLRSMRREEGRGQRDERERAQHFLLLPSRLPFRTHLDDPTSHKHKDSKHLLLLPHLHGDPRSLLYGNLLSSDLSSRFSKSDHVPLSVRVGDVFPIVRNVAPPVDGENEGVEGVEDVIDGIEVTEGEEFGGLFLGGGEGRQRTLAREGGRMVRRRTFYNEKQSLRNRSPSRMHICTAAPPLEVQQKLLQAPSSSSRSGLTSLTAFSPKANAARLAAEYM